MSTATGPFDLVEKAFWNLSHARRPLTLPATLFKDRAEGLAVPLTEARRRLLLASTPYAVRDSVVAAAVRRAQSPDAAEWRTGVAGLVLPGLRALVGPLTRAFPSLRADLEAESLVGLFEALPKAAPDRCRLASHLIWAGRTHAARFLTNSVEVGRHETPLADPVATAAATAALVIPQHPDLALQQALQAGVVDAQEANVIGETRIGDVRLHDYAAQVDVPYGSVRLRRYRAEQRLALWARSR